MNNVVYKSLAFDHEKISNLSADKSAKQNLDSIIEYIVGQLSGFVNSSKFVDYIDLISDSNWEHTETKALLEDIIAFKILPEIKIVPFSILKARGAFGNNTIYLSQDFLEQSIDEPQKITEVIFEEIGHYLDAKLSQNDSPGDEGAIFASLVQKQSLGTAKLSSLKRENDRAVLNIGGREVAVELADWHPSSVPMPKTRKAWEWPFAAESIWNMPLGSNAVYEPANIETGVQTATDIELFYRVSEQAPLTRLYAPGSWTHRCSGTKSPTGNPAEEMYIRFPKNELVADANLPYTPNSSASILQPDGKTLVAITPLARCEPASPVYGWYMGTENIYGTGITGSHGGSGLSAFGGSIRLGELTQSQPIRHALKIDVWAHKYLHYDEAEQTPGYRWPAIKADGYAADDYGGINKKFEMGSLLAIPPEVTPESLGIESLPALKLFYALQDYGAYVVDDTAWNVTAFNLQEGVEHEFEQTYGYEFETNDQNSQWFQEYYALVESLHLVANNSPNNIGGGGTSRRALVAPPFASDTNTSNTNGSSTIGEIGKITDFNHQTKEIAFSHSYKNPVVFAQPLSRNGRDPAIVRIADIQSDSFTAYLDEPNSKDGTHTLENFSYLVLEAGNWILEDGTKLEVGTLDTNATVASNWEIVNFNTGFVDAPVVLSQVQTNNGSDFVRTRQKSINNNSFQLAMEEEEALKFSGHVGENIGWLAISSGQGNWNGQPYQAGSINKKINHQWKNLTFNQNFEQSPQILASLASYNGGDSAGIRYQNSSNTSVDIMVEEDTSLDLETNHTLEDLSFLAIEGTGSLTATAYDF